MEKFTKKVLGMALVALVLAGWMVSLPTFAQQVGATEAAIPRDASGGIFPNADFIGVRKHLLNATATATQIVASDQGVLYGICRMGATLGDYTVAFDYDPAETLSGVITGMSTAYDVYIMSPYVYVDEELASAVYTQAESVRGCWFPKQPVRFESGLIGKNNSAGGYSLYFFRTDAGVNPY